MSKYEVIVGNIGTVYSGNSVKVAKQEFMDYVELSKRDVGRAAGEDVTVMVRGEPELEHTGWLSMEMGDDS